MTVGGVRTRNYLDNIPCIPSPVSHAHQMDVRDQGLKQLPHMALTCCINKLDIHVACAWVGCGSRVSHHVSRALSKSHHDTDRDISTLSPATKAI